MSTTPVQAATHVIHALVPLTTIIAWKVQSCQDADRIKLHDKLILELEKELNTNKKEIVHLQKELIGLNKWITEAHETYATCLESIAHTIVQSCNHIQELEAENAKLKRDLSQQD